MEARSVLEVFDDVMSHEERASKFIKRTIKTALGLNKNLTEEQLVREINLAWAAVQYAVTKEIGNVRKGVRSWS